MSGLLPEVNQLLADHGSSRRYRNLFGVTLGTGLGGGVVIDGRLLVGDNGNAAEIWLMRHRLTPELFAEEAASVRGVRRAYAEAAGVDPDAAPEPREIAGIAAGEQPGDGESARQVFRALGQVVGEVIAEAVTLLDGLVVIGGGMAAAHPWFMPALMETLSSDIHNAQGGSHRRLVQRAFNLECAEQVDSFVADHQQAVIIPGIDQTVAYNTAKHVGIGISRLGTGRAVSLGAREFAISRIE